jgi:hypothetical protein
VTRALGCIVAVVMVMGCTERSTDQDPPRRAQVSSAKRDAKRPPIVGEREIATARDRLHPAPEPREPRVFSVVGTVRRLDGGVAIAARDTLPAMQWIETGADGHIVFDFPQDGRVEIEPQTRFAVGEDRPMQILLASGAVHAVLVPIGNAPRSPMRIATPSSTSEITGSGDIFVRTSPDGADTTTVVLLGEISMHTGTREATERPAITRVHAGQSYASGSHHRVALSGTLTGLPQGEVQESGQVTLAALRAARSRVRNMCEATRDVASVSTVAATQLEEALTMAESNLALQRTLDESHQGLSRRDPRRAMGMMGQIAGQAQRVARDRQYVLSLWEEISAYGGCAPLGWQARFLPLRERVRTIIGSD